MGRKLEVDKMSSSLCMHLRMTSWPGVQ